MDGQFTTCSSCIDCPAGHYCEKVVRKLEDLDLEYEFHTVVPFRIFRFRVRSVSGQSGVPVIVDPEHGIEGMAASDRIVTYLEETYA